MSLTKYVDREKSIYYLLQSDTFDWAHPFQRCQSNLQIVHCGDPLEIAIQEQHLPDL